MLERGVSLEDARDYSAIGCIEVAVPGKWGYRVTGMSFLNMPRILLATLNDGVDATSGKAFFPGTGKLADFATFDELMDAWRRQVAFYTRASVEVDTAVGHGPGDRGARHPLLGLHRRLHRARQDRQGGRRRLRLDLRPPGRHRQHGQRPRRDQAARLRGEVGDEGGAPRRPRDRLRGEGRGDSPSQAPEQGAQVRQRRRRRRLDHGRGLPRLHGRDHAVPTTRASGAGRSAAGYFPGTSSISSNVPSGAAVKATPDGRKAGTPLAEGSSPSSGTDLLGPTAVLSSVGKLPAREIFGGVLLNQKLDPGIAAHARGPGAPGGDAAGPFSTT